jgi:hypothetical protein
MRAWAKTSVPVIIQHDDFVWTAGPFMSPDFYRQVIIPRYAELWKPLHAAGKNHVVGTNANRRSGHGDSSHRSSTHPVNGKAWNRKWKT